MKRNLLILLLAAGLMAACGDDDEPSNNTPSEDVGTDVEADAGPDAETDVEDDVEDDGGTQGDFTEEEPNNTEEEANTFTVGEPITGQISQGSGENSDIDIFQVDLTGGKIFEFELTEVGSGFDTADGNMATVVFADAEGTFSRALLPDFGTKRQAFVPADGTYLVYVYDARSGAEEPIEHGGADSTYEIATSVVDPSPTSVDVPVDQDDELEEDGVDVFEVSPADDTTLIAETTATRAPVSSDLDTVLYAWSAADSQTIATNDDFPGQDGTYDSSMAFSATGGQTYWIVVDSYSNAQDASYNLSVTETDDAPTARRAIGAGDSLTGEISDAGADDFDTDYFEVTLQPGETIRLEATADDAMQPRIDVLVSSFFGPISIAEGRPVDGVAAVELAHPSSADGAGTYQVNVDDARNVPLDENTDPENVGGSTFGYTFTGTDISWTATTETLPFTSAGSITNVGNYDWYEFAVTANTVVGLQVGGAATADFEPVAALLLDGAATTGDSIAYVATDATDITAGMRDSYFRGGTGYDADLSFINVGYDGVTFTDVAESESNDQQSEANDITADIPAAVTGTLDGAGPSDLGSDYFQVTLTEGDQLGFIAEAGADGDTDDADTVVTVVNSDGDVVFENDDYLPQENGFFSAGAFAAPADGDYFIVVEPYCTTDPNATDCGGNGDYTLKVFMN
jgi:hypothetical protein